MVNGTLLIKNCEFSYDDEIIRCSKNLGIFFIFINCFYLQNLQRIFLQNKLFQLVNIFLRVDFVNQYLRISLIINLVIE